VDAKEVPYHTLLVAGFPCQSFSIAGKRKGFEDTRGTLFFDVARIIETKRPSLLLFENVKGLLSAQKGYCFYRIIETLDELGYDVEWQVLNSKYFGVPQNRERVFIIGHLRGTGSRQIFPIGETCQTIIRKSNAPIMVHNSKTQTDRVYSLEGISPTLTANTGGRHIPQFAIKIVGKIYPSKHEAGHIYDISGIAPTIKCNGPRANSKNICPKILLQGVKVRRLTPIECERLQGFPDNWTKYGKTIDGDVIEISDSQRYRVLGNAMTVNVMEFLGNKLKECLNIEKS
jgi:DNA (cytosine-5)-methyltransferase 1